MRRMPVVKTFAGSLTTAATKTDLTASYAKVGSAANIHGLDSLSLLVREHANVENLAVKFFTLPDGALPTASTSMYQLVTAASGAEVEVVVVKNTYQTYPLTGLSGKWLLLEGKGASGTSGDISAFLFAEERVDKGKSLIQTNKITILGTATELTTSYADVGSFIDIAGLSNLCLYVYNSAESADAADINVYIEKSNTQPSATTTMHAIAGTNGAALVYSTLSAERAVHPLGDVAGRWLGIKAKSTGGGTAAAITVFLTGIAQGV